MAVILMAARPLPHPLTFSFLNTSSARCLAFSDVPYLSPKGKTPSLPPSLLVVLFAVVLPHISGLSLTLLPHLPVYLCLYFSPCIPASFLVLISPYHIFLCTFLPFILTYLPPSYFLFQVNLCPTISQLISTPTSA
jgi:hypothetical protein